MDTKIYYIAPSVIVDMDHFSSTQILITHLWVYDERPAVRIGENDCIFCRHSIRGEPFIIPDSNGGIISE